MRISTVIQNNGADFEQRKKILARKEMDQAYKKQAKYVDPKKNPVLQALENLLSGKTEKELHEQDNAAKNELVSENQLPFQENLQYTIGMDNPRSITDGEVSTEALPTDSLDETIQMLEKIRQAALAPVNPSPQDLRVAASATAQIQVSRGELQNEQVEALLHDEEMAPYANESFNVDIPKRFLTDVERDAQAQTVFGKDLEKLLLNRTFNKAKTTYTTHIAMVKNSYRSYNEPLFSRTA